MSYPFTKSLEHHGLVAGFCKEIDLANIIDRALGTSESRTMSFGNLFIAMIINGLGFTGRTLHMWLCSIILLSTHRQLSKFAVYLALRYFL